MLNVKKSVAPKVSTRLVEAQKEANRDKDSNVKCVRRIEGQTDMFEFVESDGKGSENNIPCSSNTTVDNVQGTSVNTCFVSAEVHQVTHHQLESIEEENIGNLAQKESIRSCSNSRTNPNNDKRERCAKVKKEND